MLISERLNGDFSDYMEDPILEDNFSENMAMISKLSDMFADDIESRGHVTLFAFYGENDFLDVDLIQFSDEYMKLVLIMGDYSETYYKKNSFIIKNESEFSEFLKELYSAVDEFKLKVVK